MICVRAYGLAIASEIALDDLDPCEGTSPDVTIERGPVDLADRDAATVLLDIGGVARFAIRGGREIRVDPCPTASLDTVRLFLMGSAFGALLQQRGLLVLHGNAIRIGDACMICLGPSGAGKSTLAAGFAARGYPPLADDVVAVTPEGFALPGLARIRLWRDAAERLGYDVSTLGRVRPDFDKYHLHATPQHDPLPVCTVHVLGIADGDRVACGPLKGFERFHALRDNSYRPAYLGSTIGEAGHLDRCAALAATVPMFRTLRPVQGFSLDAVMDAILAQARGRPVTQHA